MDCCHNKNLILIIISSFHAAPSYLLTKQSMAIGPVYNYTWLSANQLPPIVTFGFVYLGLIGDRRSAETWDPREF